MIRRLKPTEFDMQRAVIDWAVLAANQCPELRLLHHIPNGGFRFRKTAAQLKASGVAAGVPDLHLPVGRGGWLSLYIEMKRPGNEPTDSQASWIKALSEQGNLVQVCHSAEVAIHVLRWYLELPLSERSVVGSLSICSGEIPPDNEQHPPNRSH